MKRLIIALAACATTLFASAVTVYEGFESSLSGWGEGGAPTAYDVGDLQKTAANYPFADSGSKYCAIDSDGEFASPAADDVTYFDMYVQFPAGSDDLSADLDANAKLAVYLNSNSNIVVVGGAQATHYDTGYTVVPGTWVRLTIHQRDNNVDNATTYSFRVFIDGQVLSIGGSDYVDSLIPASKATQVAFEGSGAIDNFVARNKTPFAYADADEAAEDMQYVCVRASDEATDGMYFDSISAGAIAEAKAVNLPITLIRNLTADKFATDYSVAPGATFTVNANGHSVADAVAGYSFVDNEDGTYTYTRASGWAYYLGPAVDGAYEIDNLTELKAFQENVGTLPTVGETFKLTADIALDAAWPGIGLQNGKDDYNTDGFNAAAFCGTFDGQNHTISNFQMVGVAGNPKNNGEGLDYCGFFNSIYNATIQNLKIEYAGSLFAVDTKKDTTHESGATFVGVAKSSTLRNLTTLPGTVSCDKGFGGIVGYLTSGTLVDSCTNNVNMTSLKPNKCGGIAMITQGGSAVTIRNCQNNGTIAGSNETGSLVGYIGLDTTIEDCDSTVAYKLLHHQGSTVTVSGITADASVASYSGVATPGLNFATVDNGVATFVADGALALNGSYKVMSGNATATYEFTDVGSIAFNTSLATPTSYAITSSGTAGIPVATTENNVTTYTAGYFPRTATAGQDGSAAHPFEIADVDDLQALAAYTAGHSLCYIQVADIDMATAGTFPGIGGDFTGTYDGGNKTISNIQFAADTYRGLFNKTTGATIKNLKIDTVSFATAASGTEFGGSAFVGKVYDNTVLSNLTAKGSVAAGTPCNHSVAGIATRVYGPGVKFFECANEASVYGEVRKVGGVLGIIQGTASVDFVGCSNSGTIVTTTKTHHDIGDNKDYTTGADGLGGIIAFANAATTLKDCVNTGAIQTHAENTGAAVGGLIGKCGSVTITDLGGNSCAANMKMIGVRAGTITVFLYATVANNVATTVDTIAAGGSYLLEGDATPSITLAEGESIAFDTALGYTLTETSITAGSGLEVSKSESGTVKTYTAAASSTPVKPGEQDPTPYTSAEAATNAAAKVTVDVPAAVKDNENISAYDKAAYAQMFEAKVVDNGNGTFSVEVALKSNVEATIQTTVDAEEEDLAAAAVAAAASESGTAKVTTVPGLYYVVEAGSQVNGIAPASCTLAETSETDLTIPNMGTSGFYKIKVSVTPVNIPQAQAGE